MILPAFERREHYFKARFQKAYDDINSSASADKLYSSTADESKFIVANTANGPRNGWTYDRRRRIFDALSSLELWPHRWPDAPSGTSHPTAQSPLTTLPKGLAERPAPSLFAVGPGAVIRGLQFVAQFLATRLCSLQPNFVLPCLGKSS